jgi:hypothetical protein
MLVENTNGTIIITEAYNRYYQDYKMIAFKLKKEKAQEFFSLISNLKTTLMDLNNQAPTSIVLDLNHFFIVYEVQGNDRDEDFIEDGESDHLLTIEEDIEFITFEEKGTSHYDYLGHESASLHCMCYSYGVPYEENDRTIIEFYLEHPSNYKECFSTNASMTFHGLMNLYENTVSG